MYLKNQKDAEQQEHHDGKEHEADGHAEVKQVVSFRRSWRVDLKHMVLGGEESKPIFFLLGVILMRESIKNTQFFWGRRLQILFREFWGRVDQFDLS